ncbi:Uncharacterised protein [Mycobacterium tuberculosis]|nr:Uncharacterised protein [Mycobacterium tuberculosis]
MQPAGNRTFVFTFDRNPVGFTVRCLRQGILADLLIFQRIIIDIDTDILPRAVIRDRLTINRRQFETGDKFTLRLFADHAEFTQSFPSAL